MALFDNDFTQLYIDSGTAVTALTMSPTSTILTATTLATTSPLLILGPIMTYEATTDTTYPDNACVNDTTYSACSACGPCGPCGQLSPEEQISDTHIHKLVYQYYQLLYEHVNNPCQISLKSKRQIFSLLRASKSISINHFLPAHGITVGELMFMNLPKLNKGRNNNA